jgi:WD40 repeat protein
MNDAPGMTMSAYVWDAVTGKQIHGKIEGARLAFSPDAKRIASTDGIVIRTWDAATGEERTPVSGPTGGVLCLSFSADGGKVVAGYDNVDAATFRTWDVESRKVLRTFGPNPQRNLSGLKNKQAAYSPDGKSLFAVHWHRLLVLDASTGNATELEDTREQSVRWLAFGPDGKNVAALEMRQLKKSDLSFDRPKCEAVFRFLDGSSGRDLPEKDRPRWAASLQRLAPEPGPNTLSWSVSADFRLAAWVRLDDWENGEAKDIRLREIATGKELPAVGFGGEIRALALSPDSRVLAAITADRRLLFWDIAAAKEIASWPNPHSRHNCVAFRPDGKTVAVGCADSTILLYDVPGPPESTPVAADDLGRIWTDLASADTAVAYRAIARLRADPKSAVELFKTRLSPIPKESANAAAMVADLDNSSFAKREAASAAIAKLGEDAIVALRSALANKPSPEHRERLEKALANLKQQVTAPEDVRRLRALQVLEQIGDAPSIDLLKKMGEGASEAWITQEAKESVARLTNRQ